MSFYTVQRGDSLWRIAARELGDSRQWSAIASLNQLAAPYLLFVGQTVRLPPRVSVRVETERLTADPIPPGISPLSNLGQAAHALQEVLREVDRLEELRGAAVALRFPQEKVFLLRESQHASGLKTAIMADIAAAPPADERSFWERWSGVAINCGGAALSLAAGALASAALAPSLGASTPLVVLTVAPAAAAGVQCGLAVTKETSESFREYLEGEDGRWVNYADIALDVITLFDGVKGALSAVKTGNKLLQRSRYAKYLNETRKGKLVKTLQRIEQQEGDLVYFRDMVRRAVELGKAANSPTGELTNNLLKRSLPFITKSLRQEQLKSLIQVIGGAVSTVSSAQGGVGNGSWGVVSVTITVMQESLDRP